jgi:hypothetical protein
VPSPALQDQPHGAAGCGTASLFTHVQGSGESNTASPPPTAASSACASVRMVSQVILSFLVLRQSDFLIRVR